MNDGGNLEELLAQYNKVKRELEQKMYEWEILTEELEALKNG
jgi:ATP-binding cassette subfamily F protein 3